MSEQTEVVEAPEYEYMSADDFAAKVEWEGGVVDALEYGLKHTDLDPNDELSRDLREAWKEAERIFRDGFEAACDRVQEAMVALEEAEGEKTPDGASAT